MIVCISVGVTAWLVGGCGRLGHDVYAKFQHENPAVRMEAIGQAARTRDSEMIPHLVDRLTDSEDHVRFFAFLVLRELTGQTEGYRYYETSASRAAAAARWREWLERREGQPSAPEPQEGGGT